MELAKKNTDQAKAILSEWKDKGVLKGETYKSTKTRKDALGVTLVEAKVAAIVNQTTPYDPDC